MKIYRPAEPQGGNRRGKTAQRAREFASREEEKFGESDNGRRNGSSQEQIYRGLEFC